MSELTEIIPELVKKRTKDAERVMKVYRNLTPIKKDTPKSIKHWTDHKTEAETYMKEEDYEKAVTEYSNCLRYAPESDPDVSYVSETYYLRAIALYKQCKYAQCLRDIKRAVMSGKDVTDELTDMRMSCENELKKKPQLKNSQLPALDFGRSAKYCSMSEAVDMSYNETIGRHIVATRNIPVGK